MGGHIGTCVDVDVEASVKIGVLSCSCFFCVLVSFMLSSLGSFTLQVLV